MQSVIVVSCWGAHTLPVPFAFHVDDGEVTDEVSGALHERAFLGGWHVWGRNTVVGVPAPFGSAHRSSTPVVSE